MDRKKKIWFVQKTIRYLANFLLLVSIFHIFANFYTGGVAALSVELYISVILIWQVVIMLILTENFYLPKK